MSPLLESDANLWYHIIRGFDNRPPTLHVVYIIFFVSFFGSLLVLLSERAKCASIIAPSSPPFWLSHRVEEGEMYISPPCLSLAFQLFLSYTPSYSNKPTTHRVPINPYASIKNLEGARRFFTH
jgi:hypothetical protein